MAKHFSWGEEYIFNWFGLSLKEGRNDSVACLNSCGKEYLDQTPDQEASKHVQSLRHGREGKRMGKCHHPFPWTTPIPEAKYWEGFNYPYSPHLGPLRERDCGKANWGMGWAEKIFGDLMENDIFNGIANHSKYCTLQVETQRLITGSTLQVSWSGQLPRTPRDLGDLGDLLALYPPPYFLIFFTSSFKSEYCQVRESGPPYTRLNHLYFKGRYLLCRRCPWVEIPWTLARVQGRHGIACEPWRRQTRSPLCR